MLFLGVPLKHVHISHRFLYRSPVGPQTSGGRSSRSRFSSSHSNPKDIGFFQHLLSTTVLVGQPRRMTIMLRRRRFPIHLSCFTITITSLDSSFICVQQKITTANDDDDDSEEEATLMSVLVLWSHCHWLSLFATLLVLFTDTSLPPILTPFSPSSHFLLLFIYVCIRIKGMPKSRAQKRPKTDASSDVASCYVIDVSVLPGGLRRWHRIVLSSIDELRRWVDVEFRTPLSLYCLLSYGMLSMI